MAVRPRQLVFDMAHRPALEASDFLVSPSNAAAVDLVDQWPEWQHWGAMVVGPAECGKSHLANVWRYKSGAAVVNASDLDEGAVALLQERRAIVVEDVDRGIASERVLFHLLNIGRQEASCVLLTSRVAAGVLEIDLPDLRSRLRALPFVMVEPPDEHLLQGLLVKLFADRQLAVEPAVIGYLAVRIERSMEAANGVVEAIDRLALETHRRVTRNLAHAALSRLGLDAGEE